MKLVIDVWGYTGKNRCAVLYYGTITADRAVAQFASNQCRVANSASREREFETVQELDSYQFI